MADRLTKRRWRISALTLGLAAALLPTSLTLVAAPAAAMSPLGPARFSTVLMDADSGEILYEEQATAIRHPASITKVMTLYLAFNALDAGTLRPDDRVQISARAANQAPSKLGLRVGQSISVADAIGVVAVKSANDIAVALAEKIGGSEAGFARMMNAQARALGMRQTNFVNASGLPDPAHFTSARDIALLSAALLRNHRQYYANFSQLSYSYGKLRMANHNHLLGNYVGLDGIKTGFTVDSGFTLTASAERGGRRLIAVVLGAPTGWSRDKDITRLLDTGFTALQIRASGGQADITALLSSAGFALNRAERPLPAMMLNPVEQGDAD